MFAKKKNKVPHAVSLTLTPLRNKLFTNRKSFEGCAKKRPLRSWQKKGFLITWSSWSLKKLYVMNSVKKNSSCLFINRTSIMSARSQNKALYGLLNSVLDFLSPVYNSATMKCERRAARTLKKF